MCARPNVNRRHVVAVRLAVAVALCGSARAQLDNASFETPDTLAPPYSTGVLSNPSVADQGGAGWEFLPTGLCGITSQWGPFVAGAFPAADGTQFAYLQTSGQEFSQTIDGLVIGEEYVLSWSEARRPSNPDPAAGQIWVLLDASRQQIELMPPHDVTNDAGFAHQSVTFVATRTSHLLRFVHLTSGWDVTTLIDDVVVRTPAAPAGNFDFETGDLVGWTVVSGDAWSPGPVDDGATLAATGWEGRYCMNSHASGESATGVLRSGTFALNSPITFLISGYSFWPGVHGALNHNYVTLNRAADNAELARAWTPQRDDMRVGVLAAPQAIGDEVYIEVVDSGDDPEYAWMAVDFFVQDDTADEAHAPRSDAWPATDALGRDLPLYDDVGARRPDRYVGIFYLVWLGEHGTQGPFDISQIQASHPYSPALYSTLDDYLDALEPHYGPFTEYHHWGRPLFDYYVSTDVYVMRKHMQMLADAGVDTLIVDNTNGFSYANNVRLLMSVCQQILNEGGRAPQITMLANRHILDNAQLEAAYNMLYEPGLFPDTWFRWEGKPLLLIYDDDPDTLVVPQTIQDFFTTRICFGASVWPWFGDGYKKWLWTDLTPQAYGWDQDPAVPEEMSLSFAWFPPANMGRSFAGGVQPAFDAAPTEAGLHFAEQAERVLALDPEFAAIAGWNEWVAGRWELGADGQPDEHVFLGTTRYAGDSLFVDAYNAEYSRDAEPVQGGHGDSHYYQMVDFIRRFKGADPPPTPSAPRPMAVDGDFSDWTYVKPEYRDYVGDAAARNAHPGYFSAGPYTNLSGRNDIVAAKVTYDESDVYFYVQTREAISDPAADDWLTLYVDIDSDPATGWEGYDRVVNRVGVGPTATTVEACAGDAWQWSAVATADYAVADNELELRIPRGVLGQVASPVAFDFKWADNAQPAGDVLRFTTHGDAAPGDRFNYRYANAAAPACAIGDLDCDADADLADLALFSPCVRGQDVPPALGDACVACDFDADGDADSEDVSLLLYAWTGP